MLKLSSLHTSKDSKHLACLFIDNNQKFILAVPIFKLQEIIQALL
uniref:Uncharacterized protein n=1 Tax=Anguilla anguilla TaxID=7936 RepID=A0A0E9VLM0_ANGAN